jgi:hypothetical protein
LYVLRRVGLRSGSAISPYINSMPAAFSLFNVPETFQARYELFRTAYVDDKRITIVDQPLIPRQNLTSLLQIAKID